MTNLALMDRPEHLPPACSMRRSAIPAIATRAGGSRLVAPVTEFQRQLFRDLGELADEIAIEVCAPARAEKWYDGFAVHYVGDDQERSLRFSVPANRIGWYVDAMAPEYPGGHATVQHAHATTPTQLQEHARRLLAWLELVGTPSELEHAERRAAADDMLNGAERVDGLA